MSVSKVVLLVSVLTVIFFSGCSMKNDFHVTLPKEYKIKQLDYVLSGTNVQLANKQKSTGDLDIFDTEFTSKFEKSLKNVLNNSKIFSEQSDNKITIKVVILKNDAPAFGFDMDVYTDISYVIKSFSGKTIYDEVISAKGTATAGEEFAGVKRMILANNRSIKNNIKMFLDDIQIKLR